MEAASHGDRVPGVSRPPALRHQPLSRRTALGWALLGTGAAAVGCDGTPGSTTSDEPASAPPTVTGTPDEDPDVVLLRRQVAEIDATAALVATTVRRHRSLADVLRPVARMHAAHRALLADADAADAAEQAPGRDGRRPRVPRRAEQALDAVRRREGRLADGLADAAVAAESGSFARALASMSASVSQHLAEATR